VNDLVKNVTLSAFVKICQFVNINMSLHNLMSVTACMALSMSLRASVRPSVFLYYAVLCLCRYSFFCVHSFLPQIAQDSYHK